MEYLVAERGYRKKGYFMKQEELGCKALGIGTCR